MALPASRRVDGARALAGSPESALVAIGNFDGVHRGHQDVILAAVELARARGLVPLVLTFEPHPSEVLGRGRRALLTTLERKIELITRLDPTLRVVVEPFTLALAQESPEQFAQELLARELHAKVVIVGDNFRFGHRRAGDLATLRRLGEALGFEARAEPLTSDAGGALSSSRVRAAVAAGDVEAAALVLGRPHSLSGRVVEGDRRGRTIGVPTANLDGIPEARPANGVYASLVDRLDDEGGARSLALGVTNLGVRPTVGGGPSVETHLLDFDGDLYGARLRLHLVARLREERRFDGLEALVAQIRRDVAEARALLAARRPDPAAAGAWC
ncbi:MAG: bifunctional riboflavin kinase/FAD synthetase [Sorangiineae bacterium]|nr:bifunctional riboflavin kinase/FAD synthetase [Polyangiaceae bacterium]MEB2321441.1 bifunctional riboflavin kinase/FAD synthetase [Sorangiineae bacterium]